MRKCLSREKWEILKPLPPGASQSKRPGPPPDGDKKPRIIAHIDADAFFAALEQGFNPLLRDKPVIIGGNEMQRGVVHTASYEARSRGVKMGMSLAKAKQICPEATFLKGNYQQYRAASMVLQAIYLNHTPVVEFTSLDDAYLDMTGMHHLYPDIGEAARKIQQEVNDALHISISIGFGSSKVIARIASGLNKPHGVSIVPCGQEKQFLASLPVDKLPGIGRTTKEKLTDLKIFTISQLAALPAALMAELFGAKGKKMWELANGVDDRKVKPHILPGQISRETTFEEDLTDRDIVLGTLQYLTERIAGKMRKEKWLCHRVGIKIRYSDYTQYTCARTLKQSTDNAQTLFAEAKEIVARIPFRRLRIRLVGVWVTQMEWRDFQLSLFDEENRLELLDQAVDEIRQRFGFMAILPAETLELRHKYRIEKNGFVLHSPALTR